MITWVTIFVLRLQLVYYLRVQKENRKAAIHFRNMGEPSKFYEENCKYCDERIDMLCRQLRAELLVADLG